MIEDARARQRRQRGLTGVLCVVAAAITLLALGFTGGRGGGGGGHQAYGGPGAGGSPTSGHVSGGQGFPGAPPTQPGSLDWSEGEACSLARPNRFLAVRSGCVTVTRGEVFGGGRQDLIVIYSKLGRQPVRFPAGSRQTKYQAKQAVLEVVRPGGATQSTPIPSAKAASLLAVSHVNSSPGEEIFLQTGGISSGSYGIIYDGYHGRLLDAGTFTYGGDSGVQATLGCLPGATSRVIQSTFEPVRTLNGPWRGTKITYVWRRGRLVQVSERKLTVSGTPLPLTGTGTPIGLGCLVGIGSYRTATGGVTTPVNAPAPPPRRSPGYAGLAHGTFLDSITRWEGTLYGSGAYNTQANNGTTPKGSLSRCRISCDPTIWAWTPRLKRWRPVFVNHGTPRGSDQLFAFGDSLLDFTTTPGTRLFRTTNGSTYTLTPLPAAMAAGILTDVYRAGGSLIAIVMHGNQQGAGTAPVVWTSTNTTLWTAAKPVSTPGHRAP